MKLISQKSLKLYLSKSNLILSSKKKFNGIIDKKLTYGFKNESKKFNKV